MSCHELEKRWRVTVEPWAEDECQPKSGISHGTATDEVLSVYADSNAHTCSPMARPSSTVWHRMPRRMSTGGTSAHTRCARDCGGASGSSYSLRHEKP